MQNASLHEHHIFTRPCKQHWSKGFRALTTTGVNTNVAIYTRNLAHFRVRQTLSTGYRADSRRFFSPYNGRTTLHPQLFFNEGGGLDTSRFAARWVKHQNRNDHKPNHNNDILTPDKSELYVVLCLLVLCSCLGCVWVGGWVWRF